MHPTIYPPSRFSCMEKMARLQLDEKDAKSTQCYSWPDLFLGPASVVDLSTRSLVYFIIIG